MRALEGPQEAPPDMMWLCPSETNVTERATLESE